MTREITATYGIEEKTESTVLIYGGWYVFAGSKNINLTDESLLVDGVDTEMLPDYDYMHASRPVESMDDLIREVDE